MRAGRPRSDSRMSAIIGYWGSGASEELDAVLVQRLNTTHNSFQHLNRNRDGTSGAHVFSLHYFGQHVRIESDDDRVVVSLAASGLATDTDALIEAGSHGLRLRRDPFGRVPLFWLRCDEVVWFSSQLQLLIPILKKSKVATAGLYGYACFSSVPLPLTPLENILAVPAGSEVEFVVPSGTDFNKRQNPPEGGTTNRWHEWRAGDDEIKDEAAAVAQLRALLMQVIEEQISDLSAEPVGVFLSGGLDSSMVAAMLVRAGIRVRAYALDFGEYGLSELPFAESVAQHLAIPLVKVDASPRRIRQALTATARALDLPFGDGVTVPLFLLNKAASRDVRVVFNGEGGDQLFAGWTNKPIIASGIYEQSHPAGDDFEQAYLRTFHRLHGYEAVIYSAAMQAEVAALHPREWLHEALDQAPGLSLLHRLRRANLMLKGAQNIQPRATNLSFAHGLALRTPFCSLPLAEWTFRVSSELSLRGSCEKYLLKRAVEEWLPAEVVWREKRGMGVPLTQWCLGPLWRELGRWLRPDALRAEGCWQNDLAMRVAMGQLSGQVQGRRIGEILWLLLMWQVWRQTLLPSERAEAEDFKTSFYNPFWLPPRVWQWKYQAMM